MSEYDYDVLAVIPTYGHLAYAERAAASFLRSWPWVGENKSHVLIVDDGTPDQEWYAGIKNLLLIPRERVTLHRYPVNDRNMTRAWNDGALLADRLGAKYTVLTNSDVIFPLGWFEPVRCALDGKLDLAAPMTNAPGHRRQQDIRNTFPDYVADDSLEAVDTVQRRLNAEPRGMCYTKVNGFCLVSKTTTLFDPSKLPFKVAVHPSVKMEHNEEWLEKDYARRGLKVGIACGSFVFHYRGVTRERGRRGPEAAGMFRPTLK